MENQQNNPNPVDTTNGRRRLLKMLAAGGVASVALPEKWVKPVVDAVIVPAHAQGSIFVINGIFTNQPITVGSFNPGTLMDRFAGLFISSANAALPACQLDNTLCVAFDCTATPNVAVYLSTLSQCGIASSTSTTIFPNNAIADVSIDNYNFTNLVASSSAISGVVSNSNPNVCSTSVFTLPLSSGNPCNLGFLSPTGGPYTTAC